MVKQLLKGLATFVPGAYSLLSRRRTGGTESARYCYSVWLRHLVMAYDSGLSSDPKVVAELGPGDSIGIGLAGLMSGAEEYHALDVVEYGSVRRNLHIFDELVQLFNARESIPDESEFPRVGPKLKSYRFPSHVLRDDRLRVSLDRRRLDVIRASVEDMNRSHSKIHYNAPWCESDVVEPGSVDMIFSQAVLEHVDELDLVYRNMHEWLKPGGFMSHEVDFRCHGTADQWNGHWAYTDLIWKLIRGKRPFLINRLPHSRHISLMEHSGFKVILDLTAKSDSRIDRSCLAPRFRDMQQDDLVTSSAFMQSSKSCLVP